MKMKECALLAAALAVGAGAGWLAKPAERAEKADAPSGYRAKPLAAESKVRVKTVTSVVTNTVREVVTNTPAFGGYRGGGRGFEGFRDMVERMKTENPREYAAMTNRMARFRSHMLRQTESRLDTLAAVDTSGWSRQHQDLHERYQNLIVRREELMEMARPDAAELSEAQRRELWREIGDVSRELREVSRLERDLLLDKTFEGLGYSRKESAEIKEAVSAIFQATQEHGRHGGPRGFRGR
jgi:hypothetical protein